jgi:glutathione synthase/RimK-type ligase-like ATP-grasp enzyme
VTARALDVALITCGQLPEPDHDAQPLLGALTQAGLRAAWRAWDDPRVDWASARLGLLRSTWNYPRHARDFAAWAARTAAQLALHNPWPVVQWNMHKGYLLQLAAAGVAVTPTQLVRQGERVDLAEVLARRGWRRVVIKPAVSAGSFKTRRFDRDDTAAAQAFVDELAGERDVLLQDYLPAVEDHGERALIWIDGELTHAVRKSPRFSGDDESVSGPLPIAAAERALALAAIAAAPGPLLYARVDMAPGPDGAPVLMELELIEPSLFFAWHPPALARFVAGLTRRLRAAGADDGG